MQADAARVLFYAPSGKHILDAKDIDWQHRLAAWWQEEAARRGEHCSWMNGDATQVTSTEIPGELDGQPDVFEFTVDQLGEMSP